MEIRAYRGESSITKVEGKDLVTTIEKEKK